MGRNPWRFAIAQLFEGQLNNQIDGKSIILSIFRGQEMRGFAQIGMKP
jgi:hypothetical protein